MRRGFRTFLQFLCLTGAILLLLPWGAVGAEQAGPKMVIKELEYDFKQVKEGEVIEHSFLVSNKGDQVLEIRQVKPG
jgi:hypothetical protein